MEQIQHQTKMNASEYAVIWSQYINDSLSSCVLQHMLKDSEDKNIREVFEFALELSERHLEKTKKLLKSENQPLPIGFSEEDVNPEAPGLFTDAFKIVYLHIMALHGLTRYAGATSVCSRKDIRQYFMQCTSEALELYDRTTEVALQKGIIDKAPTLHNKQKVHFVKNGYMKGWLGKRRPINAIEISGVFLNMQKTMVKMVLELGFSQVCKSNDVRAYMERARGLCVKHFEILASLMKEENLHVPKVFESEVTDSIVPPFSDKLMLFHITGLLSAAISYYGEAAALSQRRDIVSAYTRMNVEVALIAEDGMQLMIKNAWFEAPPAAADHEALSKE
ncbi:DUF3231 family protein [Bacillus infantis]|uniref:DUF3231 family protein n=1 Tax=Bacillus infantis TaxID=324767 RepID=UPI003CF80899